jgi:hypothetical protein
MTMKTKLWMVSCLCLIACDASKPMCAWDVGGVVQLCEVSLPDVVEVGKPFTLETQWVAQRDGVGTNPQVFVHVTVPGGSVNLLQADHAPMQGSPLPMHWRPGDVLRDRVTLELPATWPASDVQIAFGWYEGGFRWPVQAVGAPLAGVVFDAKARRLLVTRAVKQAAIASSTVVVPRRQQVIALDGACNDEAWATSPVMGPFAPWDGKASIERKTSVHMLWDPDGLWLCWEATDPDPFSPYRNHDDPLYDGEALELFIDGNGDSDDYVELQANLHDAHFDASFEGGARNHMNRAFTSDMKTVTVYRDGLTTAEWQIPWTAVTDKPSTLAGSTMRMNLFRLEHVRAAGRVVRHEASAWQSPMSGDFHVLSRFGFVQLAP